MTRRLMLLILPGVAPAVAVWLLASTGALAPADVVGFPDPGAFTRVGLPLTQAVRDVGALLTVGALVLAATCVPPPTPQGRDRVVGARRSLVDLAAATASVWFWASLALVGLTYSEAAGVPVTDPSFLTQVSVFGKSLAAGQSLLLGAAISGVLAIMAMCAQRMRTVAVMTVGSLIGLWTLAMGGHAAGALNHSEAVNLQLFHWVGIAVWAGGLGALALTYRRLGDTAAVTVGRYSTLAGWCLAVVAASGVLGGLLRIPNLSDLLSTYGGLLALKAAALTALAGLGAWQRRRGLRALQTGRSAGFLRVVVVEVVVLGLAAGAGVALSRSQPPEAGGEQLLTTAQALLGHDLPPPLGAGEWFTQWRPDALWLPVALGLLVWYATAVARLRARGDGWPLARSLAWVAGWLLFVWATSGAPGAYGRVLFSMHMVQHMTLALAVPTLLVMGAPVTLAVRTLRRRADGSLGPREWLLAVVHSWPARVVGSPFVVVALVVVSLVVFYYSSLLEVSLRSHSGHVLMTVHFLLSGYLFANCLIGVDPGPKRPAYPLRVLMILVTFGFHALFSVSLMASNRILGNGWFAALERPWGRSLTDDQYLGASLGWALGDYPLAILAVGLVVSWVHADRRERRRLDRQAERDGDRLLTEYNTYLGRLSIAASKDRNGSSTPTTPPRSG